METVPINMHCFGKSAFSSDNFAHCLISSYQKALNVKVVCVCVCLNLLGTQKQNKQKKIHAEKKTL